jgi:glucokinase
VAVTLGIDVGGTKIAAGAVDDDGSVIQEERRQTPARDAAATRAAIVDVIRELAGRHEIAAVGIGAAGFVDVTRSNVLFAPNVAWRDEPLRSAVEAQVDLPVIVENDVNAAAWGEFRFGAAADIDDDLLMIAVGTGIGGGIIIDGELIRGTFGVAGEVGHMRVVPGGLLCGCGRHGCWEQYASGRALVRLARSRIWDGDLLLEAASGDADKIDGQMITKAAHQGDPLSIAVLADIGTWLGAGIATLASVLDPGTVVLGGGVSDAGDLLLDPVKKAFDDNLSGSGNRPHLELRVATLGNEAGMIGCADLARRAVA